MQGPEKQLPIRIMAPRPGSASLSSFNGGSPYGIVLLSDAYGIAGSLQEIYSVWSGADARICH